MERKIGEIFLFGGEWYQCVEGNDCVNCVFIDYCKSHSKEERDSAIGLCVSFDRNDGMHVIFKKLEKIGEPFTSVGNLYQHYNVFDIDNVCGDGFWCVHNYKAKTLTIEIKQTKEDMEEKKLNLKPFDLEAAKAGKPVCTRDGHKARIICFDYNGETGDYPIVALVHYNKGNKCYERVLKYTSDGLFNKYGYCQHNDDLMMLPEKKEGWVNVYKERCYESKEEAIRHIAPGTHYIDTIRVEWEE